MQRTAESDALATVLLIGRDDGTLAAGRLLEAEGYRVLRAVDTAGALEALRAAGGGSADAAAAPRAEVCLLRLEGARESADRLRAVDPTLPLVVLADGLAPAARLAAVRELGVHGIADRGEGAARTLERIESAAVAGRAARHLLEAHEVRSLVADRLCEDLYGILHVVRHYADALDDLPPPHDPVLERLQAAARASVELAESYLDLRRLEGPVLAPRLQLVEAGALFEDLEVIGRRRIGDRPLWLRTWSADPDVLVLSEPEKLQLVLAQVLIHVIERTAGGEVRLGSQADGAGGLRIVIGPVPGGAPAADLTAMPIAIARRLCRLVGADLALDPASSSFVVRVPAAPQQADCGDSPVLH